MSRTGEFTPVAAVAAEVLRGQIARSAPLPRPGERTQGIAALEEALALRARRRRTRWVAIAAGTALAAGAAAAVVSVRPWTAEPTAIALPAPSPAPRAPVVPPLTVAQPGPGALIYHAGESRQAEAGSTLEAGDTISQPGAGSFVATLASGARLELRNGPLDLVESGPRERMLLRAGTVHLTVPKLGDRRLVVGTPDTEVEVRGTRFTVALGARDPRCGGGTPTRVSVEEGVVVVRHAGEETRVAAGQEWPVCEPEPRPPRRARAPLERPEPIERPAPAAVESSTLAEQNDLFAAAVSARRRGQNDEALRLVDDLLRRFPDGPLAGDARAERQRLLAVTGQAP